MKMKTLQKLNFFSHVKLFTKYLPHNIWNACRRYYKKHIEQFWFYYVWMTGESEKTTFLKCLFFHFQLQLQPPNNGLSFRPQQVSNKKKIPILHSFVEKRIFLFFPLPTTVPGFCLFSSSRSCLFSFLFLFLLLMA